MRSTPKLLSINDHCRKSIPTDSIHRANTKDFLLLADRKVRSHEAVPIWVGWNALSTPPSELPVQKVWYLPQIKQSPTSNSVVKETLRRSLQIAEASGRECIASTFDLAIAKNCFSN